MRLGIVKNENLVFDLPLRSPFAIFAATVPRENPIPEGKGLLKNN